MLVPWVNTPGASELIDSSSRATGVDLQDLGTRGDATAIRETSVTQPLTVLTSILSALGTGILRAPEGPVGEAPLNPAPGSEIIVAGHSLGFLTALAVCGALSPVEAVELAARRGRLMAQCSATHKGTMAAVVGGDREQVRKAAAQAGLTLANVNSAVQVVISGEVAAVSAFQAPPGSRVLPLSVGGAFHSPAMAGAIPGVAQALTSIPARPLLTDLIDDADGARHPTGSTSRALVDSVAPKITLPVRWDRVLVTLKGLDLRDAVELAPAGMLTGLARRELAGLTMVPIRTSADAPDQL